jgi:ABC-type transport system involved in multi-copper enzyme maturation permease subunit
MRILFMHSVRERTSNLTRNLLAGAVFLVPLVMGLFEHGRSGLPGTTPAFWFALVFGAGLIGPDASAGILELVLTRPVSRSRYVLARWLSAVALTSAASLGQTLVMAGIKALYGHAPALSGIAGAGACQISVAIGVPAVLIALSSMTYGYGDLRLWVLCLIFGEIVELGGKTLHWPLISRLGTETERLLLPQIGPGALPSLLQFPWNTAIAWLSTVVLALAIAMAVLNRRELSHGGS